MADKCRREQVEKSITPEQARQLFIEIQQMELDRLIWYRYKYKPFQGEQFEDTFLRDLQATKGVGSSYIIQDSPQSFHYEGLWVSTMPIKSSSQGVETTEVGLDDIKVEYYWNSQDKLNF